MDCSDRLDNLKPWASALCRRLLTYREIERILTILKIDDKGRKKVGCLFSLCGLTFEHMMSESV